MEIHNLKDGSSWAAKYTFVYTDLGESVLWRVWIYIVLIKVNIVGAGYASYDSYLQGRTQVVTVNEIKSSHSLLTCRVSQGSVLGPILFIVYTQPLSDVVNHHSVSHHIFADDTELYKSDSPSEAFTLAWTIECISNVKVWVVQNKLQLNEDRTDSSHRLWSWSKLIYFLHYV